MTIFAVKNLMTKRWKLENDTIKTEDHHGIRQM